MWSSTDVESDEALVWDGGNVVEGGLNLPPPRAAQNDENEDDDEDDDDEEEEEVSYDPGETPLGCGIFGQYPITALLGFVVLGLVVGIGLSSWRPEVRTGTTMQYIRIRTKIGDLSVCFHVMCPRVTFLVVSDEVCCCSFLRSFFPSSSLDAGRTGDEIDNDSMVRLDRCVYVRDENNRNSLWWLW